MATLQWVGGGDNQASDPNDWIDTSTGLPAVPELGDTLAAGSAPPAPAQSFTMNVKGDDLVGSSLGVYYSNITVNLSHHAFINAYVAYGPFYTPDTFNVSQKSTLNLELLKANVIVNLSQGSTLSINPGYIGGTINVFGHDTLTIPQNDGPGGLEINLAQGAKLSGTFVSPPAGFVMNGAEGAVFLNNGASMIETFLNYFDVDVAGKGTMTVSRNGNLEFIKSVGSHQSVLDGGIMKIDSPNQFHASATLTSASSQVDLMGLAKADSYTFKNDLLKIFSCNNVIDKLRLTDQTPYGFDVVKTAGSVNVVALSSSGETLPGALPVHAWV